MLRNIVKFQRQRLLKWWQQAPVKTNNDAALCNDIAKCDDNKQQLQFLIDYFWQAQRHYATKDHTRAYYPGFASMHGSDSDGIEGVSRLLPLWAAYVSYSKNSELNSNIRQEMLSHIKQSLLNGTNPNVPGYWGDAIDGEQIICEAADIALAIYLSKQVVFAKLTAREQTQITTWLSSFINKQVSDNNWHLFIALIDAVLSDIDNKHVFCSQHHLQRIQDFYVAHGAFTDGEDGQIDYYNAWCFHYFLFWIYKIAPEQISWDYPQQLLQFCQWYQYLFTTNGFPLYGRSVCYRFAAATPLLAATLVPNSTMDAAQALSINHYVWRYFISNGAISKGRPNQGLFGDNASTLDNYSGPASAFWGTRSLVMAMYVLPHNELCEVSTTLPSHAATSIELPELSFSLRCLPENNEVVLNKTSMQPITIDNSYYQTPWKNGLREAIYGFSFRGQPSMFLNKQKVSSHLLRYHSAEDLKIITKKRKDSCAGN